jgi:hypothetical protein
MAAAMTEEKIPVAMGENGQAELVTASDGVDRTEMFNLIREMEMDELAIFEMPDDETGKKTMTAVRNLHKRVPGKAFRSFYQFPKIYVIRYA